MYKIITVCCLAVLTSCVEPIPTEVIEDAPEASLVVTEKIMSPETRALENKVANRTLLQKVVDESETFQRTAFSYACSDATGGLLTFIKDKKSTKGIRFAASEEGWTEFLSLYYKSEDLAFAVYEKGEWMGDEEQNVQTIFYLDDGVVFRCLEKKAVGRTNQIEGLIAAAEFEVVTTNSRLLTKIKDYEQLFKEKITEENIAAYFCH